jgi:chromate transporter
MAGQAVNTLVSLALIFSQLSLLSFGGGNAILPEMQRQVVEVHHWMTAETFSALFALGQSAPGPNMMIVPLVGWHVAGWAGVLVTSIAKFGPSSIITMAVLHGWDKFREKPWRRLFQRGFLPITCGLFGASAAVITQASVHTWALGLICAGTVYLYTTTKLHPLWYLAAGCLVGMTGIGQG